MSGFETATAVEPIGPGRYRCDLDGGWSTLAGINGGMMMAILSRVVAAEAPDRSLRSLHCQFLRPPKAGPAEITVETIRSGARATNLRLKIEQGDKVMVEALAVAFTGGLRELARWTPTMPSIPLPEDGASSISDPRMPSVAEHVTYTPRIGPPPISGTPLAPGEPARTGGWLELVDPQPIEIALIAFYSDAWWPAALGPLSTMAFNPTIDITLDLRTTLPPGGLPHGPLLVEARTEASLEGLCDEDVRVFAPDGTLLAQARQLAITMTPEDRPMVTRTDHSALN